MRRRSFLAGLTLGALPKIGITANEALRQTSVPWDVIVVGAGGAGLAAAVAARESGAERVLLLEKSFAAGGHTLASSGSLNALVDGFGDSAEHYFNDTFEAGGRAADPELVERLVNESRTLLPWLRGLGVDFEASPFEAYNGAWPRAWGTIDSHPGFRFVEALMRRLRSTGGRVRYGARAAAVILRDAEAAGVRLEGGEEINARAVVLATGGWGANPQLRRRWSPLLTDAYRTTYSPLRIEENPATGDGIRMAEAIGAKLRDMDAVMAIPYWGGRVLDYPGAEIFLDDSGRRFTDETANWATTFAHLARTGATSFWVVTDGRSRKGATFAGKVASGVVKSAPDLAALAREMGVEQSVLEETFRAYNAAAMAGRDEVFGRTRFTQTLAAPPVLLRARAL